MKGPMVVYGDSIYLKKFSLHFLSVNWIHVYDVNLDCKMQFLKKEYAS
nr:MAG TPA: hypothetical protein [Caudoviricetes sp.]